MKPYQYVFGLAGLETEPKLPPALCTALYQFILLNNLCPVKVSICIFIGTNVNIES